MPETAGYEISGLYKDLARGLQDLFTGGLDTFMIADNGNSISTFFPRDLQRTAGSALRNKAADAMEKTVSMGLSADPAEATKTQAADGGGFFDFLKTLIDIVNPLQHIPVVSTLYREITGDEISPAARIAGDTLYGGPVGTAVALVDVVAEEVTGKDMGRNVMAILSPKDSSIPVQLAENKAPSLNDIIWDDVKVSALDRHDTPTSPHRTGMPDTGLESAGIAAPPSHLQSLTERKRRIADIATAATSMGSLNEPIDGKGTKAALSVDPPRVLHKQDAPAGGERISPPPELIAQQMLQALDKYASLKGAESFTAQNRILDAGF